MAERTCPQCDGDFDYCAFKEGEPVTWNQDRKWGGTQPEPATFIELRGQQSARIKYGDKERTVTLKRLRHRPTAADAH